jgi:hypothetical protein
MLAGQLQMWAVNVYWLLGFLIALAALALVLVACWTGLKILIWHVRRRRALQEYVAGTYRADGKRYPPFTGGTCDGCGRVSRKIYYPENGPRLCSTCYERYWRENEAPDPPSREPVESAGRSN